MKRQNRPLLVLLLGFSTALHASENTLSFAQESSIPPIVNEAFKNSGVAEKYVITTQVNPFYVQGDFNGDGRLDCAILIKEKLSGKLGIAIVHAGEERVRVLGAGQRFGNGGDDFSWLDAWYVYSKSQVHRGASAGTPPKLKGDALMVIKAEAASSLIYWTGAQYRWYQQGD